MRKLLFLVLLLPLMAISQNESFLLNMTEITVKQGHSEEFLQGMRAYRKCYSDNGGNYESSLWRRVQGDGNVYVLTSTMQKWAEMDEGRSEAGSKCWNNVLNYVRPHIQSVGRNIARSMPDLSRKSPMPETTTVVYVYNVITNDGNSFTDAVKELVGALKKAEGDSRGTWYSMQGGAPGTADFFVALPNDNFAAMDVDREGVWTVYEKANGKAKTEALRAKFRAAVSKDWSYLYRLIDLSNQ